MAEIRQALDRLNARLCTAVAIGEALDHASDPDNPPAWVQVYRDQLEAVRQGAEALEALLLPHLAVSNGAPLAGGRTADRPVPGSMAAAAELPSSLATD